MSKHVVADAPAPRPLLPVLLLAACGALAACAQTTPRSDPQAAAEQAACLVAAIQPWVVAAWADQPERFSGQPRIAFADQGTLRASVGATASVGSRILATHSIGTITLWDRSDLDTLEAQSTIAHELAHWVDYVEGRNPPHAAVYALQARWIEAHWPEGVPGC